MGEPEPRCPACRDGILDTPHERAVHLCDICARKLERAMPGPMLRPPRPCARCNHTQLVRAVLTDGSGRAVPASLGSMVERYGGVVARITPDERQVFGALVAYICRGCGFTELYTEGFADIPIGRLWGTELVDVAPSSGGPFR